MYLIEIPMASLPISLIPFPLFFCYIGSVNRPVEASQVLFFTPET
jgi:hypothetical protein